MKLGCERLEQRDVPATLFWDPSVAVNGDYLIDTPLNWRVAPAQTAPRPTAAPVPGDDLHFTGVLSNANAVIPAYSGGGAPPPRSFGGVHLEGGYTGTVDFRCSAFVGILDLTGAPLSGIAQNDPYQYAQNQTGGQISVTGALNWTSGSVNWGTAATKDAFLNLMPAATGTAAPVGGGMVDLGSAVTLIDSGTVPGGAFSLFEGTFKLHRDMSGIEVQNDRTLYLCAPVKKVNSVPAKIVVDTQDKTNQAKTTGVVDVKAGGEAVVKDDGSRNDETRDWPALAQFIGKESKLNNAGNVKLQSGAWLAFDHTDANSIGGYTQGPLPNQDDPAGNEKLVIEAGCKITCWDRSTVDIESGKVGFTEKLGADNKPLPNQPEINITGSTDASVPYAFQLRAGTTLARTTGRTVPILFYIDGSFYWAGTVELYADHTRFANDQIWARRRIFLLNEIGGGIPGPGGGQPLVQPFEPPLNVAWFDATTGAPTLVNGSWELVKSSDTPNTGEPAVDPIQGVAKYQAAPDFGTPDDSDYYAVEITKNADKNKFLMAKK